ncbi:hypothetical protein Pcinc_013894 [Petrolisthes cinctipes]|uniref:DNA polymerase kappa n=1 Tax=Petrolisthes cinctipes TaxID=88211 RepID=A0AAE1FXL8_PETCI|nr:hypothetical protein Pcinc_013894 [Petrolisthes cinctipes]
MEGLDTEKINEIIKNASEGSRFYQHKQKRQQELDIKLDQMKEAAKSFTDKQIKEATKQMDQLMCELEAERDLSHTIVHIDMDMFYAAVEMRDDPTLRDKPMAVGGTGMLSTSNYAARRFGVRAAMPGFIGKKLCPDLIIVPLHFDKYKKVSKQVQEVMAEYDPNFCAMSLDEAYLDITQYLLNNYQSHDEDLDIGSVAQTVVAEMREKIQTKTQLTASAGIAPNTRLAKVCSDLNKPNGQYYLPPDLESIKKFVSALSIRKVSGIGNVSEQHLHALGITQCSHLMEKRGLLRLLFSDTSYHSFMSIALGQGHSTLSSWNDRNRKSISNETTFKGTSERGTLIKITESLCQELADEMDQKDIVGKVLTLKLKTINFEIRSRAQTLSAPASSFEVLFSTARRILLHEMNTNEGPLSLRLLGVRMSSLMNSAEAGSSRQATLTQMFSKATQEKTIIHTSEQVDDILQVDTRKGADVKGLNKIEENGPHAKTPLESEKLQLPSEFLGHNKARVKVESGTTSVKSFLLKNKESLDTRKMEEYECSVCGAQIRVRNMEEFNRHLDFCLEKHASCDPTVKLSSCEESNLNLSFCQNKSNANCRSQGFTSESRTDQTRMKNTRSQQSAIDQDSVNVDDNNGTVSESLYICPVCHKEQSSDIGSLTKHVDDCLSTSAISEMLKDKDELQGDKTTAEVHGLVTCWPGCPPCLPEPYPQCPGMAGPQTDISLAQFGNFGCPTADSR